MWETGGLKWATCGKKSKKEKCNITSTIAVRNS